MAYVWALLAAVQPAFATVTDASDPAIRALMKLPASLADLGLAALVAYALRDRPRWALVGGAVVLLVPATWYVSAWWGQYEAIFALSALAAAIAAADRRNDLAAVLIAVSLMTKPQAIAFVVPFAAWFWATGGWRGLAEPPYSGRSRRRSCGSRSSRRVRSAISETWALTRTRSSTYCRCVPGTTWWILQVVVAGGEFIRDDVAFIGPVTLRHVGYVVTAALSLVIGVAIIETSAAHLHPRGRGVGDGHLHLDDADARAVCLCGVGRRAAADPHRPVRWFAGVLAVVFTLNLVAAVPATPTLEAALPVAGLLGMASDQPYCRRRRSGP